MKSLSLLLVATVGITSLLPSPAQSALISGRVNGGSGMQIAAIGLDGTATSIAIPASGKFRLTVPASRAKNASLHLFSPTGEYFGPVLLASNKKTQKGYVRLTAQPTALGKITLKTGFAKVNGALTGNKYYRTGSVQLDTQGAPLGAGKLGLVKTENLSVKRSLRAARKANSGASNPNDPCGTLIGADCDQDGIPNSLDVDDNGNLSIDMTDANSVQTTARLLTYSDIRPNIAYVQNANSRPAPTRASINSFLGQSDNSNGLRLSFYFSQRDLTSNPNPLNAVWVECTAAAPWCSTGTASATANGFSEYPQILPGLGAFGSIAWSDFHGSTCSAGTCSASPGDYPGNALLHFASTQGGGQEFIWAAFVRPNDPSTLENVTPTNVISLKFRPSESGTVSEIPVSLSPYFVTTPALMTYTANGTTATVDYPYPSNGPGTNDSTAIALGSDGSLNMTFWRPQRLPLPGETESYYDVGGLHYGLTVDAIVNSSGEEQRPQTEAGCTLTANSGLEDNTTGLNDSFATLAPLRDLTLTDQPANPERTVSFTADIARCVSSHLPGVSTAGLKVRVSLLAMGEPLPHGANRTGLSFTVSLP